MKRAPSICVGPLYDVYDIEMLLVSLLRHSEMISSVFPKGPEDVHRCD